MVNLRTGTQFPTWHPAVLAPLHAAWMNHEARLRMQAPLRTAGQRHWGWWQGDYPNVLGANVVWCLVIFGWTFAMMAPFFYLLKLCGLLRISPEEEEVCTVS